MQGKQVTAPYLKSIASTPVQPSDMPCSASWVGFVPVHLHDGVGGVLLCQRLERLGGLGKAACAVVLQSLMIVGQQGGFGMTELGRVAAEAFEQADVLAFALHLYPPDLVEATHINLNDNTVEGIRLKDKPAFSVQYHPEASPGPHDARYLFDQFVGML